MRISDWSSDVCSSDLLFPQPMEGEALAQPRGNGGVHGGRHENSGTNHGPPINARSPSLHPLRHEVGRPSSSKAAVATLSSGTFSEPSRSEEHTSELQSLMRLSYAVFCLQKKNKQKNQKITKCKVNQTHYNIKEFKNIIKRIDHKSYNQTHIHSKYTIHTQIQ